MISCAFATDQGFVVRNFYVSTEPGVISLATSLRIEEITFDVSRDLDGLKLSSVITILDAKNAAVNMQFDGSLAQKWYVLDGGTKIFCQGQILALGSRGKKVPVLIFGTQPSARALFDAQNITLSEAGSQLEAQWTGAKAVTYPVLRIDAAGREFYATLIPSRNADRGPEPVGKKSVDIGAGRQPAGLVGLEVKQIGPDSLLITKGFPIDKTVHLGAPLTIKVGNSGDIEKLLFQSFLVAEKFGPTGKFTAIPANTGINIVWEFTEAGTSFRVGEFVYTAQRKGSTLKFTEEGVLLDGLTVVPLSQWKTKVVGKAADFDKPLSTFGPVTNIDVTIPPAPGAAKAATASNSAGRALIAKVVQGLGGAARVRSVKSLREKSTILAKTPQGDMSMEVEEITAFPDQIWEKMTTPVGEITMVISPAAAFMKSPMGSHDLSGTQKEDGLKELKRHPIFVAQHAEDPKFIFAAGGSEQIGEVEAQILDVNADGVQVRWYVDPQTGRVLRTSAQALGMGGQAEGVIDYSGWKEVEGISLPFKLKITESGKDAGVVEIKEVQINPAVDPKLFEKPTSSGAPPA
jgi:hypothetical protein